MSKYRKKDNDLIEDEYKKCPPMELYKRNLVIPQKIIIGETGIQDVLKQREFIKQMQSRYATGMHGYCRPASDGHLREVVTQRCDIANS